MRRHVDNSLSQKYSILSIWIYLSTLEFLWNTSEMQKDVIFIHVDTIDVFMFSNNR